MRKFRSDLKRTIFLITFVLFLGVSLSGQALDDKDLTVDETTFNLVMDELEVLILEGGNQELKDMCDRTFLERRTGNLQIIIEDEIPFESIPRIGNFGFYRDEENDGIATIAIESKLLKLYPENKSLVMGIFVNLLTHAYMHYTNYENYSTIQRTKTNIYPYQMKSISYEVMFFDLCQKKGLPASNLEKFLITSKKEDQLATASLKILKTDYTLFLELIKLRDDILDKKILPQDLFAYLKSSGEELVARWKDSAELNNWEKYKLCIEMSTYYRFIGNIANQCLNEDIIKDSEKEVDEIQVVYDLIDDILDSEEENIEAYYNESINMLLSDF